MKLCHGARCSLDRKKLFSHLLRPLRESIINMAELMYNKNTLQIVVLIETLYLKKGVAILH